MEKVTVRPAEPEDSQNYMDWLAAASDRNMVDLDVYGYPACVTFTVQEGESPILMNSQHPVMMMEALAPKPGITPRQEAIALKKLFEAVKLIAQATGTREIWFACKDESLNKFVEHHGFEKITVPMYRIKVPPRKAA
jgi:hypothetical protein